MTVQSKDCSLLIPALKDVSNEAVIILSKKMFARQASIPTMKLNVKKQSIQ